MSDNLKHQLWVILKIAFLVSLYFVFVLALVGLFQGKAMKRRAASGFILLPFLAIWYFLSFGKIPLSLWSAIAHLGSIVSISVIGVILFLHQIDVIEGADSPYLGILVSMVIVFSISLGTIYYFLQKSLGPQKSKSK